jgi:hypothetical protein
LVHDSARFVTTLAFDVYRELWDHVHERPWSEDAQISLDDRRALVRFAPARRARGVRDRRGRSG